MDKRYVSIAFLHLTTDWFALQQPDLKKSPFVVCIREHGRMVITAANRLAQAQGIHRGMVLADARAIVPSLQVADDKPDLLQRLLRRLAEWCIRFTPIVAVDLPDGLLLDVTGCAHLWGGEEDYRNAIVRKLSERGYTIQVAIADTIGTAWAVARWGQNCFVVPHGRHIEALLPLPPEALRIESDAVERFHKLGLHRISQFINIPRQSLRRRFGVHLLMRLDSAVGAMDEVLEPVQPVEPYQERLPCLEPIVTAVAIEIALDRLLNALCQRLQRAQIGLRAATLKGYRVDGKVEQVHIGTNRPSYHVKHLYKLFLLELPKMEPGWGIELFTLDASVVEDYLPHQEKLWEEGGGLQDVRLSELLDRLAGKIGTQSIHRYIPDEHYWPERSYKLSATLHEKLTLCWPMDKLRPVQLLSKPERIDVTAPIPDYPPMLFRYKGIVHNIAKADGPERIEQVWWLQQGQHRDYYRVEDESGQRYWLFRLGHYHDKHYQWFIHGFFA